VDPEVDTVVSGRPGTCSARPSARCRREAVAAYTRDAAAALGVEGTAGVLRAGAAADMVELAKDPWTEPPDRIGAVAVAGTWSGGRRTH
jgi:predicted amidohydrolase YtcJ